MINLNPNVSKVENAEGPRHQGRSPATQSGINLRRLPQGLDNEGIAVLSAFLKGKQHSKKAVYIKCRQRLDPIIFTPINAKPLS